MDDSNREREEEEEEEEIPDTEEFALITEAYKRFYHSLVELAELKLKYDKQEVDALSVAGICLQMLMSASMRDADPDLRALSYDSLALAMSERGYTSDPMIRGFAVWAASQANSELEKEENRQKGEVNDAR